MRCTPLLLIGCTLSLLLCACKERGGARSKEAIQAELIIAVPDTTLHGTLKHAGSDSLTFVSEGSDETFSCNIGEALGRNQLFGSLTEGHRYALLVEPQTKMALQIVNLTELSGQWFYDLNEQRGFTITVAGALSGINTENLAFRKWKFHNGKFVVYYVDPESITEDPHQTLTDTTEIETLTDEVLEFKFRGELLHCTRQKEAIKVKFNF